MEAKTRRLMLIINPISGSGKISCSREKMVNLLQAAGFDVDLRLTEYANHATELASEAVANKYDTVIAVGGDGTINEIAAALRDTTVKLGIVPNGSGNGLARHLFIPMEPELAIDVIAKGKTKKIDYCTVNGIPFFCTFGMGFDAEVSRKFAESGSRGFKTYFKRTIEEFVNYAPATYSISANGNVVTEKALVVACCNASQYGNNAYIAPDARIDDGLIDITIIHQGTPIDTALIGVDLFTGYINKNTMIDTIRTPSAIIYRTAPGAAHLDGEPREMDDILEVKCHYHGLTVYTGTPKESRFQPYLTPLRNLCRAIKEFFYHISHSHR